MGIAFFVFGIALTMLTIALSGIGGKVTMGIAIALLVIAIAMIVYVFWLLIHYYKNNIRDDNVGRINKEIRDHFKKMREAEYERNKQSK